MKTKLSIVCNFNCPLFFMLGFIVLLFFESCDEYHYMPDDLKTYYKDDDSVIFKSNQQTYDTFVMQVNSIFDVNDKQYHHEIGQQIFSTYIGNDKTKQDFFHYPMYELGRNGGLIEIKWGDFIRIKESHIYDSLVINTNMFYEVLEIEEDTILNPDQNIYRILFNRNYGVLKYHYRNGDVCEFYKNILQ